MRPLLHYLSTVAEEEDKSDDGSEGYLLAGAISVVSLMQAIIHHQTFYYTMRGGWNCRIAMTGVLHNKLLKLSTASLHSASAGSVYNLVASDVQVTNTPRLTWYSVDFK